MSIKSVSQMNQILKSGDMKSWTNKVGRDLELGLPTQTESLNDVGDVKGKNFGDFLIDSLNKVNSLQVEANDAIQKIASGESKNVADTLIAVERADMAFKTMNQIRHKVIDAYKEIMKMQI